MNINFGFAFGSSTAVLAAGAVAGKLRVDYGVGRL